MEAKVVLRAFDPITDAAIIYSTWRHALWSSDRRDDESERFYRAETKAIKRILPVAQVRIACLSDDASIIIGYSVMTGRNLEFVFVKPDFRQKGIGELLTRGFKTYSEPRTTLGRAIAEKIELAKETKEKQNVQEETNQVT